MDIKMKVKEIIGMLSEKRYSLAMNIAIIILINLVGITLYFRLDLTRNGAYSLSDASKDAVSSLADPLTIKVFFTKDLPAPYNGVQRYITDLLEEYDQYGNRHFNYEFVDVEKDKKMASDFGIRQAQVREIKNDQVKVRNAYMGLAIIHGDLIEKIETITKAEGIEYQITNLIKKMNDKVDALLKLENPIKVTLFASSNLPKNGIQGLNNLNEKIKAEVEKCSIKNYNKIAFNHEAPSDDKRAKEISEMYGLMALSWKASVSPMGERINPGVGVLGVVVSHGGKFETIQILSRGLFGGFFVKLDMLEDRIKTAVDNLISINPKIGYVTGHKEKDINDEKGGSGNFKKLLSDMYELTPVDLTSDDIPDNVATIIINGPKSQLSDVELFKIDQFLMKGKSAIMLLDSFMEIQQQGQNMFQRRQPVVLPLTSGLEPLIAHYGVSKGMDVVLDLDCFVSNNRMMGEQQIYFAPMIGEGGLDEDSPVTKYLKRIFFLKASSLSIKEKEVKKLGISFQKLVSSSEKSWTMKGRVNYNPMMMKPPQESQMKKHALAVMLSGKFESFFKGKGVPEGVDKKSGSSMVSSTRMIEKAVKPSQLVVIGTSEITGPNVVDNEGKSPNAIFLHNIVDYLNGNVDVPEMRSKGLEFNPLEKSASGTKLTLKIINIAGLPALVILLGFFMWRMRMTVRKRVQAEFSGEIQNEEVENE